MPFYIYAWISNFLYASGNIIAKLASKHQIKNPWLYNYVWASLTLLITLPFAFAAGVRWPTHWGPILVLGIFSTLAGTMYVLSLFALDISVLSAIYNLRTAITVILGILIFREKLTLFQAILIGIMIVAGLFATADETLGIRSFLQKSVLLGFITIIFSSLYAVTVKYAMHYEGYWEVNLWGLIIDQILLTPTILLFRKELKKVRADQFGGLIIVSVVSTVGYFASNLALKTNVGISTAITSIPLSIILAFLFSVFAPKLLERHSIKIYGIRFAAAAVMILCALKLTL